MLPAGRPGRVPMAASNRTGAATTMTATNVRRWGEAPPPSLGMPIMPATNLLPAQAVVLKVWFAPPPS